MQIKQDHVDSYARSSTVGPVATTQQSSPRASKPPSQVTAAGTTTTLHHASASTRPVTTTSHPVTLVQPITPKRLKISVVKPTLDKPVKAGRSSVQKDTHTGKSALAFPVPNDSNGVTWWQGGPDATGNYAAATKPGGSQKTPAILLAHTELNGQGVGTAFSSLRKGDTFQVEGVTTTGSSIVQTYQVTGKTPSIAKAEQKALYEAIVGAPQGTRIILITCSGTVDNQLSSHEDNTVVYATLMSVSRA